MSDKLQIKAKKVYRLPPCANYEIEKTESWLADMAAKGLFLSKDGFFAGFAVFEKKEPKNVRYRMQAAPVKISLFADNNGEPDDEAKELNESYGWQYIASRGQFFIYCSTSPDARELNTDPRVQALALDIVRKRERSNTIATFMWLLVYPIVMLYGRPVLTAVNIGSWLIGWAAILVLWALVRSVLKVVHLRKIRKKLAMGEMLNHKKNWNQKVKQYHIGGIIFLLMIFAWFACLFSGWSNEIMNKNVQSLADYTDQLPFATIADFAPHGVYKLNDLKFANTIETKSDWLAPKIIKYHETASVVLKNNQYLQGGLLVDYYETIAPNLAREIARELKLQEKKSKNYTEYNLADLDVDYAVAYANIFPTVIIQKGTKVIKATFYQTSNDYTMQLNEWVQIVANSLK
ncbi:DUF2812 domain-containing protein [Clostridium sp. 'deep sea']|uniref:DUF2812 domain-containing protein n=1 Tax=Clostridium sp. 'deep sea' TaxID=2779445 RepID=UPI00189670F2|nr:DUF2812 domain-containing protein [Clostridium sp. 'deep sea']QOR36514.1 DUF2812 domain-containing protein [Clostridium sp. 'deep sea']